MTCHMEILNSEKYSRGRRGAPAKGVGRATGARVQIPLSPLFQRYVILLSKKAVHLDKKLFWKNFEKVVDKWKTLCYYKQAVAESDVQTAKRTLITEQHDQPWTILRISSEEQKPSKVWIFFFKASRRCEKSRKQTFQYESLILAQDERWRRA